MVGYWTNILKSRWLKRIGGSLLAGTAVTTLAVSFAVTPAYATDLLMHPPSYPWYHYEHRHSYDHTALRRGYQVYKQVCSACHSMKFVSYRHLVNVCLTEDEAKAHAAEMTIVDGPNEDGEMFERPGKLGDYLPSPYANAELARKANNGALPPDFSYIVLAREEKENYIFQLLTSYCDPPAGRVIDEGQHYNPYFIGGAIGMARPLYNEMIEYEDGTPATTSQMAKDVATFLSWASDPHLDFRHRIAYKTFAILFVFTGVIYYYRRLKFSYLKNLQYAFTTKRHKKEL